ncbi:predicted protein [Botrytis cinerea T4]|uniref:Uncharacterized protein n=1 Tax=Botryotinia fuckeliana (strain T4) TaxID=999810 RepID=G2XXI8_BOTF4|nr:predicted protein [Botrytis cinerea T4]
MRGGGKCEGVGGKMGRVLLRLNLDMDMDMDMDMGIKQYNEEYLYQTRLDQATLGKKIEGKILISIEGRYTS